MRPRAAFALPWASLLLAAEGILCAHFVRETPATRDETFTCVSVRSDRWNLLPGVELTGRLRLQLAPAPAGAMTLIVGDSIPLDLEAHAAGGATVPLHREVIHATAAPPDFWLEYGTPWNAPGAITVARVDAFADRPRTVALHLGRRGPRVMARLSGYPDHARASICAAPVAVPRAFERHDHVTITPAVANYFGSGWSGRRSDSRGLGEVRWMAAHGAILVPAARDGHVHVRLRAASGELPDDDAALLTLRVNDVLELPPLTMSGGSSVYEWRVPIEAWVIGTNELLFSVSRPPSSHGERDDRTRSLAFQKLELTLQ
jgi:hypothetical protein